MKPEVLALTLVGVFAGFLPSQDPPEGRPGGTSPTVWPTGTVAFVNRDVITEWEVWKELRGSIAGLSEEKREELFRNRLITLIRDKVVDQATERLQLVVSPEAVRSFIEDQKEGLGGEEGYREYLLERGQTEEEYVTDTTRRYQRSLYVRAQAGSIRSLGLALRAEHVVTPTAAEIRAYYRENLEPEFKVGAQAKVRAMSMTTAQFGTMERALEIARQVRQDLQTGADFATLARRYSNLPGDPGGDLGWIGRDASWAPQILNHAFEGAVGEVSEPIPFARGYLLVLVEDRKESRTIPFEEAQVSIREKLSDALAARAQAAVELRILKEAYIFPLEYKRLLVTLAERELATPLP